MKEVHFHYLAIAIMTIGFLATLLLMWEIFKSRVRYKSICENAGNMVVVGRAIKDKTKKIIDFEIVNCNKVYAMHMHQTIPQLRGVRLIRDLYAGVEPAWFDAVEEALNMHQSRYFEFEYAPFGTRYSSSVLCLSAARGLCCFIMDEISTEYNQQQELKRSRYFVDSILSLSGVGFWRWDFVTKDFTIIKSIFREPGEPHLRVVPNNEVLTEVHPDDCLLFVRFMECTHPLDSMMESAIFRLKNPQGEWHWVQTVSVKIEHDSNNAPTYMDGVLLDIDSLKRAQLKVEGISREVAAKQSQLLHTMRQCRTGFCSWHIPSDCIYFDDSFWESVGRLPPGSEAFIPDTMTLLQSQVLHDDPGAVAEWISQVRDGTAVVDDFSFRCQMSFLPDEWWEVRNYIAERDQDGQPLVINAFVINVSELKKHELALETAMLEAHAASKAKSRFLGIMSHEIRTPLNAIIGFSSMIQKKESLPQIHSYADSIQKSGEMLLTLINDLLDMVKRESLNLSLHLAPLNLDDMLSELREIFALKASMKGLYLDFGCSQTSALFRLDAKRLNQVLVNLIGNAVKFTDTGGITVQMEVVPIQMVASTGCTLRLCDLHISVKDTGIGIPEADFDRIFEPFEQAANNNDSKYTEGSGLGLAICENLVELMGGQITVESKIGVGSNFVVKLEKVEVIETETVGGVSPKLSPQNRIRQQPLDFPGINGVEKEILVELVAHFGNFFEKMDVGMHVQSACLLVEQLKGWLEQREAPRLRMMVDLLEAAVADFDVMEVQRICDFMMKQGGSNGE